MAREKNNNREEAFKLYKKGLKLIDISKKLGVSDATVRSWKNRYKWDLNSGATLQQKEKKKCNVVKKDATKKKVKKEAFEHEVKEVLENTNLTDKQKLFCIYYAKYFNATKAYQKAYESSYAVANTEGWKLLVNPRIEVEIKRIKANKFKGAMLEPGDILQKYIDIAFADITDYLEFGQEELPVMTMYGPLKNEETDEVVTKLVNTVKFNQSSNVDGTIISEVKQGKDGASIKLQDKMKALEVLRKNIGLLDIETLKRLNIEEERLQLEKTRLNGNDNSKDREGINDFIKTTTMSEEEIKELFKGDVDEQEE